MYPHSLKVRVKSGDFLPLRVHFCSFSPIFTTRRGFGVDMSLSSWPPSLEGLTIYLEVNHSVAEDTSNVFVGYRSEYVGYPQRVGRMPATWLDIRSIFWSTRMEGTRGVFGGYRDALRRILTVWFRGSLQRVYGVSATCFPQRISRLSATKFWGGSPGRDTSDFRYGRDWFSGLHAAVFRVVATLDFWEWKWVVVCRGGRFGRLAGSTPGVHW